jgi:hypothetical protein
MTVGKVGSGTEILIKRGTPEPDNNPAKKPYPQQVSGAFDPIPGNGTLKFRIFARELRQAPGQAAAQDFCVNDVNLGQEPDGTPSLGIIAGGGGPANTVIWFQER